MTARAGDTILPTEQGLIYTEYSDPQPQKVRIKSLILLQHPEICQVADIMYG